MDDLDRRFRTDSVRSEVRREPEDANIAETPEPIAAIKPMPAASSDRQNHQDLDVNSPAAPGEPSLPVGPTTEINHIRFDEMPPDFELLIHQMASSVACGGLDAPEETAEKLADGTVALYLSLKPQDAVESVLGRLIVAGTNATMDSFGRAARCGGSLHARDLNLRQGFKGSAAVGDLIRLLESRRGRSGSKVTVGDVNVAAGGQAIVGTVQTGKRRLQTQTPGSPAVTKKSDG